jgi:erythromycin esterase-like protein
LSELGHAVEPLHDVYDKVKGFPIVLIGEASHGTKEFYDYRCELTKQLIQGGQCQAVCIEGDWPDVSLLHAYCVHLAPDLTIENAMSGFKRFPTWMVRAPHHGSSSRTK